MEMSNFPLHSELNTISNLLGFFHQIESKYPQPGIFQAPRVVNDAERTVCQLIGRKNFLSAREILLNPREIHRVQLDDSFGQGIHCG